MPRYAEYASLPLSFNRWMLVTRYPNPSTMEAARFLAFDPRRLQMYPAPAPMPRSSDAPAAKCGLDCILTSEIIIRLIILGTEASFTHCDEFISGNVHGDRYCTGLGGTQYNSRTR